MSRLKFNSKDGQNLKGRMDESKGSRKKELKKIMKTDEANFKKAPKSVQKKIIQDERNKSSKKVKEDNSGMFI